MECYNVYVKSCLDRLGKMGRLVAGVDDQSSEIYTLGVVVLWVNIGAVFPNSKGRTEFKRQTVKYTAQKLFEKKVIRDIEGLPQHQYVLIFYFIISIFTLEVHVWRW